MGLDQGLSYRPITREQIAAWADLVSAVQQADEHDDILGADDLLEDFDAPSFDFERGSAGVYDGDIMVGHTVLQVRAQADPVDQMYLWGGVRRGYRGRGIGGWLIDWAGQAAAALHQERFPGQPHRLLSNCPAHVPGAVALFESRGYRQTRWFRSMVRDLTGPLPAGEVGQEIELRPFTAERSADAYLIRNESFRDHWGSTPLSAQEWDHYISYKAFRPAFSFVAYAAGEPAGVLICQEYDEFTKVKGRREPYVAIVGTLPGARKRGIATALLARTMAAAREDGCESIGLEVDAGSPTGALGLYERIGFTVSYTWVRMVKDMPAG